MSIPTPAHTSPAPLADALDAILAGRRSIRTYEDRPVPPALLERVLSAATHAPSPHHSIPWRLAVLTGQEAKERLARAMAQKWRADLLGDGLPEAEVEVELAKSWRRLTASPVVLVGSVYPERLDEYPDPTRQTAETLMASHSLGAALQNIMLAAHANGLSSCWMCAPVFCSEVVRDALGLDDGLFPHAIVTIGYAARPPRQRARPTVDEIVALRA